MLSKNQLKSVQLVAFDFDGVFTDNCVITNQFGDESVKCWRSDGLGLARLKSVGVKILILSTETNVVVQKRSEKLDVPCIQGVVCKSTVLKDYCVKLEIELSNTMFVGNDVNDIGVLQIVGLPIGVADSYSEVIEYVIFQTKRPVGYGAVREVCDLIYYAKKSA
jgi:3-deoxy-D-manno-octulosonate 8-phosphate phosphatase (KDO 8-P phosphatase)